MRSLHDLKEENDVLPCNMKVSDVFRSYSLVLLQKKKQLILTFFFNQLAPFVRI